MTPSMRRALNIVANCFGVAALALLLIDPSRLTPIVALVAFGIGFAVAAWLFR